MSTLTAPWSNTWDMDDEGLEIRYDYSIESESSHATPFADVEFRHDTSTNEKMLVRFRTSSAQLYKYDGSSWTTLKNTSTYTSSLDTRYSVRVVADGASVKVYRAEEGEAEVLVFDETSAPTYDGKRVRLLGQANIELTFDNIIIFADDLETEVTYAVNAANELTSMTDYNGTVSFAYDELGRMISKWRGTDAADYTYDFDDRLIEVDSNFPGEGDVTYAYGGDGLRRERTVDSVTTTYNWNGWMIASEEDDSGDLTRTYVARSMAHIDGTNPSSGTYAYYSQDHLLSTRGLYDGSKNLEAAFEFSPYGSEFLFDNDDETTHLFTGHELDVQSGLYGTLYRWYAPDVTRWMTRDPLEFEDSTNMYAYVSLNPISYFDPVGLSLGDAFGKAFDKLADIGECLDGWGGSAARGGALTLTGPLNPFGPKSKDGLEVKGKPVRRLPGSSEDTTKYRANRLNKGKYAPKWYKWPNNKKWIPKAGKLLSRATPVATMAAGAYDWYRIGKCI